MWDLYIIYVCTYTCVALFVCLYDKTKNKMIKGDEENSREAEDGACNELHVKGKASRRQCSLKEARLTNGGRRRGK